MRIECGPVRVDFAVGEVKHNQNGSAVLYLLGKTSALKGDLYLSPEEVRKLMVKPIRQIPNRGGL